MKTLTHLMFIGVIVTSVSCASSTPNLTLDPPNPHTENPKTVVAENNLQSGEKMFECELNPGPSLPQTKEKNCDRCIPLHQTSKYDYVEVETPKSNEVPQDQVFPTTIKCKNGNVVMNCLAGNIAWNTPNPLDNCSVSDSIREFTQQGVPYVVQEIRCNNFRLGTFLQVNCSHSYK